LRSTGVAPNVQITFDSASPVKFAANAYQAVLGFETGKDNWSFKPHKIAAEKLLGTDLTIGNLSTNWAERHEHRRKVVTLVGETVRFRHLLTPRQGERATLSAEQFALLAHHNTQAYIEGFRHAYRY